MNKCRIQSWGHRRIQVDREPTSMQVEANELVHALQMQMPTAKLVSQMGNVGRTVA